uniref:Transcription factor bHLH36 n=1 Tax=Nothapodytes nimmoniana TaxID=159386 RepID=A0A9E8Z2I3_NOTNI|nr:transcription factor bHLH36 [Nothapodytes nimmoniana]
MEKEDNFSTTLPLSFPELEYSIDNHDEHQQQQKHMIQGLVETSGENGNQMVDYTVYHHQPQQLVSSSFFGSTSFDKLRFADVMQFADFGPKLALNQTTKAPEDEPGLDPVYFPKFLVLNEKLQDDEEQSLMVQQSVGDDEERFNKNNNKARIIEGEDNEAWALKNASSAAQLQFLSGNNAHKSPAAAAATDQSKSKRKRQRIKTSEEVEGQRMTHIAVERNRRKQMNDHLRVLRSLMPGSYVQRGDQASIIGGAIEFVKELEQLLQCLESQKRRRLFGDGPRPNIGDSSLGIQPQQQPPLLSSLPLPNDQMRLAEFETGLHEESAEIKSCLADVEVKLLGFDALIKILTRRRPCQLIKIIAALEDLQLNILHTNITTIEQTVLYSFNVKVAGEARFTAEDIANSIQQIFSLIHANGTI